MSLENFAYTVFTSVMVFIIGQLIKQEMDNRNNSSRKRKSIISSLIAETECLLQLIQNRLDSAKDIAPDSKAFITLPINGDYFRVFDSVAADLSALNSNILAAQTIQTYMEVKGLFDDVKWFTVNAFELKKDLLLINKETSPQLNKYIQNQIIYFDEIVKERAPKACRSLEELIQNLKNAK